MQGLTTFEQIAIWSVLAVAIIGLLYAILLRIQILREDMGTEKMQEVWSAIRDGADTYLRRQLRTIIPLILVLTAALFASVFIVPPTPEASEWYCLTFKGASLQTAEECARALTSADQGQVRLIFGLGRAIAFVLGAVFSLLVGQIGMRMAVQANVRVASAARYSFGDALRIAYRAGTITGMLTDGLGLFGGTIIFIVFGIAAPDALLGFGFGGTLLALFMRVGGGIYTKAADVGADLVGKVEAGIPEDDPRNPAVVADLVGDNVGDCVGMAADIFESYEVTIVSALILGVALWNITGHLEWIIFPLIVRGIGVLSSVFGTYAVKAGPGKSDIPRFPFLGGHFSGAVLQRRFCLSECPLPRRSAAGWLVAAADGCPGRGSSCDPDRSPDRILYRQSSAAGQGNCKICRYRSGDLDLARRGRRLRIVGMGRAGNRGHDLRLDRDLRWRRGGQRG